MIKQIMEVSMQGHWDALAERRLSLSGDAAGVQRALALI